MLWHFGQSLFETKHNGWWTEWTQKVKKKIIELWHQISVLQFAFSHVTFIWVVVTCDHVIDSVHLRSISFAWTKTSPSLFCILLLILKTLLAPLLIPKTLLTSSFSAGSSRARWETKNQNKDTHTLILVGNCVMTPICFLHFYDLSTPFAFKSGQTPITTQS